MGEHKHIPCPKCGAEAVNGEDTTTTYIPKDANGNPRETFQGKPVERKVPGKVCPECGEVFPI